MRLPAAAQPELSVARAPAPLAAPLLGVRGITKAWKRGQPPVLDGVDLELRRGEVCWVGGENGAGKTTLLRIVTGILYPDAGELSLDGLHPRRDRRAYQRRIGFLSAGDRSLYARLTARQHLRLWAKLAFLGSSERPRAVEEALAALDLEAIADRRVDRLSMGQRQRVRLALALMHRPDVVLLDEPRNSLDERGTELLDAAVQAATARGGSVVWCSPSHEEGMPRFDRCYRLAAGRLEETG
jgi:ABC-2 type transport system ATP-binding protein